MAMQNPKPKLSLGNHIYFYQLLSEALGCGKQTLMPRVEEILEAERMGAADLGFDDTRELLEALSDFVELTVFKGGRIYATIVAQPAWDEALAVPEKQQKPTSGKPWKRKKTDKGLKPVRPRRVKRPEPKPEAEPEPEPEVIPEPEKTIAPEVTIEKPQEAAAAIQPVMQETADEHAPAAEAGDQVGNRPEDDNIVEDADEDAADDARTADQPETEDDVESAVVDEAPKPAISLTVVYDPEHANAGITTLVSTPGIVMADIEYASSDAASATSHDVAPCGTDTAKNAGSLPNEHAGASTNKKAADADSAADTHKEPAAHAAGTTAGLPRASTHVSDPAPTRPHRAMRVRRHHTVTPAATPSAPAPVTEAIASTTDRTDSPVPDATSHHDVTFAPAAQQADVTDATVAAPEAHVDAAPEAQVAPSSNPAPAPTSTPHTAPAPKPAPTPAPAPEPTLPAGYPEDLTKDAFCPGALLSEISYLLPLGADVMGILNEYYHIARLRGTLACSRNRATFPMGYAKDGVRSYATIRIRRNTANHGAPWLIDACTVDDELSNR